MKKLLLSLTLLSGFVCAETVTELMNKHDNDIEILVKLSDNCVIDADIVLQNPHNASAFDNFIFCLKKLKKHGQWVTDNLNTIVENIDKYPKNSPEKNFIFNVLIYADNFKYLIDVAKNLED